MLCPSCGQDKHPTIQGDQNGRFLYVCANFECNSPIGPVDRGASTAVAGAVSERPFVAAPTAPVVAKPGVPAPAPGAGALPPAAPARTDYLNTMRARLAELEATVPALTTELRQLRRMIAAAERKPRVPKTNVVPISKAAP